MRDFPLSKRNFVASEELINEQIKGLKEKFKEYLTLITFPYQGYTDLYSPDYLIRREAMEVDIAEKETTMVYLGISEEVIERVKSEVMTDYLNELPQLEEDDNESENEVVTYKLQRFKVSFYEMDRKHLVSIEIKDTRALDDDVIISVAFDELYKKVVPNEERSLEAFSKLNEKILLATILDKELFETI